MPHVIVKLWPGETEQQKSHLADAIAQDVMRILKLGEESVSIAFEEVAPHDWVKQVYQPDIESKWQTIYKKPGYDAKDLE